MGKKLPLLKPREVRANLKSLGFTHKRTVGSHEIWERPADELHLRAVVEVDAGHQQFSAWLMKMMIRESKLTQEEFCSGRLNPPPGQSTPTPKLARDAANPVHGRKQNAELQGR
jgi:predicted RNA binding protein YcfA (HicA-like mRNA interferase family)